MNSFKNIAYQILKEADKPLHSKEITRIALDRGWLKTAGKTPEATMNAQLVVDINFKKEKSLFIKTNPSTFNLNPRFLNIKILEEKYEPIYRVSQGITTKQKGDIAEARIAELITLYGETSLSCYKPISDDEGIDLIVKEKSSLKILYLQIKSRFSDDLGNVSVMNVKKNSVSDKVSMCLVFCLFDTNKGDLWDYVWFVPASDFIKKATGKKDYYNFVAGKQRRESNKWDEYMIEKKELANTITAQMKRI